MLRAVVFSLVGLQVLMPPGVCVRKIVAQGSLTRATTPEQALSLHDPVSQRRHTAGCCSGCQDRAAEVVRAEDAGPPRNVTPAQAGEAGPTVPGDDLPGPCCLTACKILSDKVVQHEDPQGGGDAVPAEFVSVLRPHAHPPRQNRPVPGAPSRPRYVTFCTLLI